MESAGVADELIFIFRLSNSSISNLEFSLMQHNSGLMSKLDGREILQKNSLFAMILSCDIERGVCARRALLQYDKNPCGLFLLPKQSTRVFSINDTVFGMEQRYLSDRQRTFLSAVISIVLCHQVYSDSVLKNNVKYQE